MNTTAAFKSIRSASLRAQVPLLFVAAVLAVALMSFYVNLLHESVDRGQQARDGQRAMVGNAAKAERQIDGAFARASLGAR